MRTHDTHWVAIRLCYGLIAGVAGFCLFTDQDAGVQKMHTRDSVTTAGLTAFTAIQFRPATTLLTLPTPWQLSTLMATTLASLATLIVRPTAVLLMWVPWPSQSDASELPSAKLYLSRHPEFSPGLDSLKAVGDPDLLLRQTFWHFLPEVREQKAWSSC